MSYFIFMNKAFFLNEHSTSYIFRHDRKLKKTFVINSRWTYSKSIEGEIEEIILEDIKYHHSDRLGNLVFVEFEIIDGENYYLSHKFGEEVVNIYKKLLMLYNE